VEKNKDFLSKSISRSNLVNLEQGKLPPQAIDLEEAVLSAMLIDKKGVDEVIDFLSPEVFYKDSNKIIFETIQSLFQDSEPIDLLTVSSRLRKKKLLDKVGGDFYLIQLTKKVSTSAHIEFHARIIQQKYIQRSLIKISNEIIFDSYQDSVDVFELLDEAESKLYDITQGNIKKSAISSQNLVLQAKKRIEEISKKDGLSGVPSGFEKIDLITSGWQPSDLIIIAARPGMGKTALTLSMARNISVVNDFPVAFFSLEMSSVQLITRLISSETGLSSEKLRTGKLANHEWEQLNVKVNSLEKAPLYVDDTPSLSIFDLRAKARRLSSQHGIKLIIIDYLQLMTTGMANKSGNREQEISTISRNLKSLAKELDLPIIALSQLSRAVETRSGTKRPLLSDLRESGAIEQDADIVSFIYRPEYYGMDEWDDNDKTPAEGQAEFIISKHRNGGLGNVRLKFIANLGKFENMEIFDNQSEFQSKMNEKGNQSSNRRLPYADDSIDEDDMTDIPF
tara:strand:+ start:30883 stop:32406 length:1524 start_codon:yes stop_codon:yes gene_type:complete